MRRTRFILLAVLIGACAGESAQKKDDAPDMVGTPPKPSEDPFFYVARPPPEAKAAPRGTIGDPAEEVKRKPAAKPAEKAANPRDDKPEPQTRVEIRERVVVKEVEVVKEDKAAVLAAMREAEQARATVERLERENALALAARDEAEARAVELRAKNAQLAAQLDDARDRAAALEKKVATTTAPAPQRSDLAQCHSCVKLCPLKGACGKDAELICGWGTGKKQKDAMLRATTECDAALESLESRGVFSHIEGNCPVASCTQ